MKSAEARDKMVAMVQDFFPKHRTFLSLDEISPATDAVLVPLQDPKHAESYIQSLYVACAMGAVPIGRFQNNLVLPAGSKM